MKQSRKGVISLPIKLTVSVLIIALTVPPMLSLVEGIREDIADGELSDVADQLAEHIDRVGMKGTGYRMHLDLTIPKDSHLMIGCDHGMTVRMYRNDIQVGKVLLDTPVISGEMMLYGDVLLELGSEPEGVTVSEI